MQDGLFEFAKAQRKYWEKKRQDDNYRIGTKQSEPNPQWGWLPRDLFRRWRLFWVSDQTEGGI